MRRILDYLNPFDILLWIVFVGVLAFLLLPLLVVIPISFSPGTVLRFPPEGLSLRWYRDFFDSPLWLDATWLSIRLGVATAILATGIGLLTALALTRFVTFGKAFLRTLVLAPLIVPIIVTAIAMFDITTRTGLARSFWGLLIAHTVLALPFAVIIIESALRNFDISLEEAATSLGASRISAFMRITMPIIAPSLMGAALFAFITSWDEVVIVLLVGGAHNQTLPVRMFEFLATQVRPTIAAISTLLIVALVAAMLLIQIVTWIRRRRLGF